MVQVKRGDVEHILTSILNRAEEQLLKKSQKELEESFNFIWEEKASAEWTGPSTSGCWALPSEGSVDYLRQQSCARCSLMLKSPPSSDPETSFPTT